MKLTKGVTVIIEDNEFVGLLARALYPKAAAAKGKEKTLFRALADLVERSDVEAVRGANKWADRHDWPRIKVDEFRRWLPMILSDAFGRYVKGEGR